MGAETNVPKFSGRDLPSPPQQRRTWNAPTTTLPANLISSVRFLFDAGLADPRGCEYREYEAFVRSVWGSVEIVKAHGWILPPRFARKQSFAVSWAGTIYPVVRVGAKADLTGDVERLLQADEAWWKHAAPQPFPWNERLWLIQSESNLIAETNMMVTKVALLLRLGQEGLAGRFWKAWLRPGMSGAPKGSTSDPFRDLASEWSRALFDRAVCAHMRGDDALALADCRRLSEAWPKLETEAARRGYERSVYFEEERKHVQRPYFDFLEPLPQLLADQERRAKRAPPKAGRQVGPEKPGGKSQRIAELISEMENINEPQFSHPGGIWLGGSKIVRGLVGEGEDAVPALLDCLENDERLTRSVPFRGDFSPGRILPVSDAAQAALNDIFRVSFKSPAGYRAYWQKYEQVPLVERWYQMLRDDRAGRDQWMQAARNVLSRTDGKEVYDWSWRNALRLDPTNHYRYVAENLHSKRAPSVAELFIQRALEIAPTNYTGDCWTFEDAADLGLMLAEWDAATAKSALGRIIRRCPALYRQRELWTSGCSVVATQFAALVDAMADLGDNSGLDLYAAWVSHQTLDGLNDALPRALAPLGRFPDHPSIREASAKIFSPQASERLRSPGTTDLLETRLLLNEAFRLLILGTFTDKTPFATIVLINTNEYELRSDVVFRGGMLQPDSFAPKIGESISFRVCDYVAYRLSRIEGLPVLELYWPEAKRDKAIAAIIQYLKESGDHLKLKPASWPMREDE